MSQSFQKKIALMICDEASRIAPPGRQVWADAMRAECDHVSAGDAFGFAVGCLYSAFSWWLATGEGVTQSARLIISTLAAILALCAVTVALKLSKIGIEPVTWTLTAIAAFYLLTALLASRIRMAIIARFFFAGLGVNLVALWSAASGHAFTKLEGGFLQALFIEECVILSVFIALAQGAHVVANRIKVQP